jgi:hypothetical protein
MKQELVNDAKEKLVRLVFPQWYALILPTLKNRKARINSAFKEAINDGWSIDGNGYLVPPNKE